MHMKLQMALNNSSLKFHVSLVKVEKEMIWTQMILFMDGEGWLWVGCAGLGSHVTVYFRLRVGWDTV